jgi:hypothetical protein
MPSLFKKLTLTFLSFLILFFSVAPNLLVVKADSSNNSTWYNQDFKTWLGKVDDSSNPSDIFGERYTSAQVQWVIYGLFAFVLHSATNSAVLSCILTNTANLNSCAGAIASLTKLSANTQDQNLAVNTTNKSLLSLVFSTDRPFSGISYVKNKVQNFSIVPVVHAQTIGFGYSALQPIQDMWSASRNVAFGLFVLAAVVFSFMIMFRVKISPQVVISVQSAIPKLVISLILVTFSYAIAGFLVDLMYVVIGILSVILSSFLPSNVLPVLLNPKAVFSLLTLGQPLGAVGLNFQLGIFSMIFVYLGPLIIGLMVLTLLIGVASGGLLFLIPLIILIVVVIVAVVMSIKIIWALLKAFVNIILLTIFAPLQIVAGTLVPSFGFGQWVKSYISNLAVFVVTGALYFLSIVFLAQGVWIGFKDVAGEFVKALLNQILGIPALSIDITKYQYPAFPPLIGMGSALGIGLLFFGVSFVIFTLIPKATEMVQAFLAGKPFAYGSAVGEALGPVRWGWDQTGGALIAGVQKEVSSSVAQNLKEKYWNKTTKPGEGHS